MLFLAVKQVSKIKKIKAAYSYGYYDEMVEFFKGLFSAGLKSNDYLEYAVLTGCLRIAKESIFTGLNNFSVYSILDEGASSCFGFTQNEVNELLQYYRLDQLKKELMEW